MKGWPPKGWDRCSLCDAWYDPNGPDAYVHNHPEPQSGPPRDDWMASKLPYRFWIVDTPEGRAWFAEDPKRRTPHGGTPRDLEAELMAAWKVWDAETKMKKPPIEAAYQAFRAGFEAGRRAR